MFEEFDFNEATDYKIGEVNGVKIPDDYLEFMREHNGGEGSVGEAYIVMYPLEELVESNNDFEINKNYKDYFIFGSDGGEMLLGYNGKMKLYYAVDSSNSEDNDSNRFYKASSLMEFFDEMQEIEEKS